MNKIQNNKVLVIGGAGFVGSGLIHELYKNNTITSLDNYSSGNLENHIESDRVRYITGDARHINKLLAGEDFDFVFHFGEYSRVEASFDDFNQVLDNNFSGLHQVLSFCARCDAKIIYSGSSTKFSLRDLGKYESPYAFSKATNTELVRAYAEWFGLKYSIVYFYNVYGKREIFEGKYATVVAKFLNNRFEGRSHQVVLPGTQLRNFTHIDDIVKGLCIVATDGGHEDYGIGSDESFSILDLAKKIGGDIEFVPERKGNRLDAELKTEATKNLGWATEGSLTEYIDSALAKMDFADN